MSHRQQQEFFALVSRRSQDLVIGGRILEIGSYDVNGSMRGAFAGAAHYTGVDLDVGPGVDVVGYGHEFRSPGTEYDIVVSGECFEHDPHWVETLRNMVSLAKPGGVVAFSCASRGRAEHGTQRSDPSLSPGTQARGHDYYRNLSARDLRSVLPLEEVFSEHQFWYERRSSDLYFIGVRRSTTRTESSGSGDAAIVRLLTPAEFRAIGKSMSLRDQVIRWPLRLTARLFPEPAFQSIAVRYWPWVLRLQVRMGRVRHPLLGMNSGGGRTGGGG